VVELADLPDLVRGYEDVKLRSVADYRERLAEMRAQLLRASAEGSGVGWS
jgi:indolepyruvate ferredoxin oxidoreductase